MIGVLHESVTDMGRQIVLKAKLPGYKGIGHITKADVAWSHYLGVASQYCKVGEELVAVDLSESQIQLSFKKV